MSHGVDGSCPDTVDAALVCGIWCLQLRPLMMMNVWHDGVSTHKRKQKYFGHAIFLVPILLTEPQHMFCSPQISSSCNVILYALLKKFFDFHFIDINWFCIIHILIKLIQATFLKQLFNNWQHDGQSCGHIILVAVQTKAINQVLLFNEAVQLKLHICIFYTFHLVPFFLFLTFFFFNGISFNWLMLLILMSSVICTHSTHFEQVQYALFIWFNVNCHMLHPPVSKRNVIILR